MAETLRRAPEPLDEEDPDRARHWAFAAFLLLFVSLFTGWWVLHHDPIDTPSVHQTHKVGPFDDAIVGEWPPLVTGVFVSAALVYLLWGWMAAQWRYEPGKWRRDVWTAFILTMGALTSVWTWPPAGASLRGTFLLAGHDGLADPVAVTARLGFGWFCVLGAALCLLVAGRASRVHRPETYEEPVPHEAHHEEE